MEDKAPVRSQNLLERLAELQNPYQKGRKADFKRTLKSVQTRFEDFLQTVRGTLVMNPDFGVDSPERVAVAMGSSEASARYAFMRDLQERLLRVDRRVERVQVTEDTNYRTKDSQSVPFVAIEVTLFEALGVSEYGEPLSFTMAFDYSGKVFLLEKEG